jgi:1,4-dihydroxy-2-naphthoate octaprenyltransferase
MYRCVSTYNLITLFTVLLPFAYHFILALAKYHHRCTQTCYFLLLYKPTAQKVKMVMKNSSMRSSRLCAASVAIPVVLWSLLLFCFTRESL